MFSIHGGNASYGIAGEKVIVEGHGVSEIVHFDGISYDDEGTLLLVFAKNAYEKVSFNAEYLVSVQYATEEQHDEEILVLTFKA